MWGWVKPLVGAILEWVQGLIERPTKVVDADDTSAERDRLAERVRGPARRDRLGDGGAEGRA